MIRHKLVVLLACAGMLLGACTAAPAEIPVTGPTQTAFVEDVLSPDVIRSIQNQISELLGVPVESIQIEKVEKRDWPDACLGLPETGEECAQQITAGWLLVFNVNGQQHIFRTNEDGTILRQEP